MEIDLYRIKIGPNDVKYTSRSMNYLEIKKDYSEERKRGICYRWNNQSILILTSLTRLNQKT